MTSIIEGTIRPGGKRPYPYEHETNRVKVGPKDMISTTKCPHVMTSDKTVPHVFIPFPKPKKRQVPHIESMFKRYTPFYVNTSKDGFYLKFPSDAAGISRCRAMYEKERHCSLFGSAMVILESNVDAKGMASQTDSNTHITRNTLFVKQATRSENPTSDVAIPADMAKDVDSPPPDLPRTRKISIVADSVGEEAKDSRSIHRILAERAATDPDLPALMRMVTDCKATSDELKKFQSHINKLAEGEEYQNPQHMKSDTAESVNTNMSPIQERQVDSNDDTPEYDHGDLNNLTPTVPRFMKDDNTDNADTTAYSHSHREWEFVDCNVSAKEDGNRQIWRTTPVHDATDTMATTEFDENIIPAGVLSLQQERRLSDTWQPELRALIKGCKGNGPWLTCQLLDTALTRVNVTRGYGHTPVRFSYTYTPESHSIYASEVDRLARAVTTQGMAQGQKLTPFRIQTYGVRDMTVDSRGHPAFGIYDPSNSLFHYHSALGMIREAWVTLDSTRTAISKNSMQYLETAVRSMATAKQLFDSATPVSSIIDITTQSTVRHVLGISSNGADINPVRLDWIATSGIKGKPSNNKDDIEFRMDRVDGTTDLSCVWESYDIIERLSIGQAIEHLSSYPTKSGVTRFRSIADLIRQLLATASEPCDILQHNFGGGVSYDRSEMGRIVTFVRSYHPTKDIRWIIAIDREIVPILAQGVEVMAEGVCYRILPPMDTRWIHTSDSMDPWNRYSYMMFYADDISRGISSDMKSAYSWMAMRVANDDEMATDTGVYIGGLLSRLLLPHNHEAYRTPIVV